MSELKPKHYIALLITLLILGWWFRYDTHCGGAAEGYGIPCISYDRFTGTWIYPQDHVKFKEN